MKYNRQGELAEVWETAVAGTHLFVPHKAILNTANDILYVADRENKRVVSFATSEGGHGRVLSDKGTLGGAPYAISFNNSSSDWPMYGVLGGFAADKLMGFTLDANGSKTGTWGPPEVRWCRHSPEVCGDMCVVFVQGFSKPHDLTVNSIQNAVYVTEIGPNKIWKFVPFPSK